MGYPDSTLLVWWASVGAQFHGTSLSWLFPEMHFPTVAFTVIRQPKEKYTFQDTPVAYEPCLGEFTDGLARLVILIAQTVPDSVVLVYANYLNYEFDHFQKWASEQSLFLPVYSDQESPGISSFYVLHELDLQALLEHRGYFAGDNQWLETTSGAGFLIARRNHWMTSRLLENQGVYFGEKMREHSASDIDFKAQDWVKEIVDLQDRDIVRYIIMKYIQLKIFEEYQLIEPFEAVLVPYGDEVREQLLFAHRHLDRGSMIAMVQAAFQLPLVVSYPSPGELQAWDWSLKLPRDIEWIMPSSESD